MSAVITGIAPHSPAAKAGIKQGDVLLSLNGNSVEDVLDYRFYMTEKKLRVLVSRDGREKTFTVRKGEYDDLGLLFETYLMSEHRRCRNNCIFCFVDQMPQGMRESLYFKDDDARLSFLFGNYITLTALSEREVERIIKMHISPINISVHTTNPELRVRMMKNRFAGESLKIMDRFAEAGIKMNCQLVLCPGINDGDELVRTVHDLAQLHPAVESVACVPVGLTKYRDGLEPLTPYNETIAAETLDLIERLGMELWHEKGTRFVYPSDEFYLLAKRDLPQDDWFEDYPQLENGVGMLTLFETQFNIALQNAPEQIKDRTVAVATGEAAAPMLTRLAKKATEKWQNLRVTVYTVTNRFFGEQITVAGLLTAADLTEQLSGKLNAPELLLSASMLRHGENVFLDDVTADELAKRLHTRLTFTGEDGGEFLDALLGEDNL